MGDRANYVIVRNGGWELFYSHWGAVGLELDLLAGPEAAVRFVRGQSTADEDSGWLSDVWAEGAALIDLDRKVLLYYSVHYEGYAGRAAVLAVLGRTWPGWEVRWAYDGQADLVAYVGRDRSIVRDPMEPDEPRALEDDDESIDLLVSVGSRCHAFAFSSAGEALDMGARFAGALPVEALVEECVFFPESGLHLDLEARRGGVWTLQPLDGALERAREGWPGWTWEMWGDRYGEQVRRSGVLLPALDMAAAYADLRERFLRHLSRNATGAARRLVARLAAMDDSVRTSPYLFDHRDVPPGLEEQGRVLAVIDAVAG